MSSLLYLPVVVVLALSLVAHFAFRAKGRCSATMRAVELAGFGALAGALATGAAYLVYGPQTLAGLGWDPIALALRIDAISVVLFLLIAFVGAAVLRFSVSYLDGEARQGAFLGWMLLTLAAVICLVLSGTLLQLALAWVATSVGLHRLLLFYAERPGAQRAARKKLIVARLGDGALLGAFVLFLAAFGTGDIAAINAAAGASPLPVSAYAAAGLLALAAILTSAQFPTHGWLTEVMETPTPVSALLHAGVVNAGGLLLIRFADVMIGAPGVLAALVMIGGFTALFGSLVMLTQLAVKTSLAWSTVAQMGFMIFQCGMALFPLALLHIVAHSLYKAYAFLSSGGAVEQVASIRRPGPIAVPGLGAVAQAFLVALLIYAAVALLFGIEGKAPQSIALGAILIFGVAYLLAQGFADKAPHALTRYTALYSLVAATAYFGLQTGAEAAFASTLPATPAPGPLEWALIVLALLSFGSIAIAQATFPLWSTHPAAASLRVHLANGLYVNALSDRLLNGWSIAAPAASSSDGDLK